MTEQWRDVVGFEDCYEVSSDGRVRGKETMRVLRPWTAAKRYDYVHLWARGKRRKAGVHVLVAEAFRGPRPSPKHEVAHWDGAARKNSDGNVRWATHAGNVQDQRRHGTLHAPVFHGSNHPRAKLRDADVLRIRHVFTGRRGQLIELAREYGVTPSTISRAATGRMWGHL